MIKMIEADTSRPKGINIHAKAPSIDTVDIDGNPINLYNLLKTYNGIMIDFFRGNW